MSNGVMTYALSFQGINPSSMSFPTKLIPDEDELMIMSYVLLFKCIRCAYQLLLQIYGYTLSMATYMCIVDE